MTDAEKFAALESAGYVLVNGLWWHWGSCYGNTDEAYDHLMARRRFRPTESLWTLGALVFALGLAALWFLLGRPW